MEPPSAEREMHFPSLAGGFRALKKKNQAGGMTLHDVISAGVLFIKVLAGTAFRSLKWCVGNLSAPVFFAVPEAEIEKRKKLLFNTSHHSVLSGKRQKQNR